MEPTFTLHLGDSREVLQQLPDNSIDSIVCDPPYGLSKEPDMAEVLKHWLAGDDYTATGGGFMGKTWDSFVPGPSIWRECLRVLKPGGHMLAFFGSRTYDMGTLAIRLAGFEIRDQIMWVYGSGFPKSMDVSKAIDKAAGKQGEKIGERRFGKTSTGQNSDWNVNHVAQTGKQDVFAPVTEAAKQWEGWGTALKPAHEPIVVARKPIIGTVAANVLEHGTGGINIDDCRIPAEAMPPNTGSGGMPRRHENEIRGKRVVTQPHNAGRWPANLIHDGSPEVVELFPANAGAAAPVKGTEASEVTNGIYGKFADRVPGTFHADKGCAARFFYCAKASKSDRDEGLEKEPDRVLAMSNQAKAQLERGLMLEGESGMNTAKVRKNNHPTVKPTDLMTYLCRLITPPNGTVLDPFMGSGSTGKAAMREGFNFIGVDITPEYVEIAKARIEHERQKRLKEATESNQIDLFN